ncbi:MAG TPA: BMP family ABC transporter substrate-binding protein [Anaerolineae bacterium]|nr:BMP family ABC transporter substrate-binding protein [Anaerolineae bacterium]
MLRKTVLVMLAMAMLLALVFGCAPKAEPTATPKPAPTTAAQPTKPPEPGKTYKVALVCGLLGDRSFVDSAARGIEWAQERLPNVETKIIENADVGEQQLAARAMAEAGYDLIVTMGFGAGDWTTEIANEYPDTQFALVDATLDIPNGTGLIFHEHTGCFTVGMVAALMSETGKIGYVGGMDVPLLRRFQEGYIQGAKYANADIEVVSGWVGGWSDPTKGKELALTQYEEGADIIFAAAGGSGEGVLAASAEVGLYSIGVDSDQCYIQPGNVMASMMKMVDVSVFDTIEELSHGTLTGGVNREYGLHNDAVGLCWLYDIDTNFADNAPADIVAKMPDVLAKVRAAIDKIKAGEICVEDYMEVYPCDNPALPGGMGN